MKLIAKCLLCLLVLSVVLPVTAFAGDSKSYTIEELGLTLIIPDDLIVFGQQIDANDPNLALYGFDKQALETQYRNNNIYLNAVSPQMNYEIVVTIMSNSSLIQFDDLGSMPDTLMASTIDTLHTRFTDMGATNITIDHYTTQQMPYIRIHYERENADSPIYSLQFFALVGQKMINLTLHSYGRPITYDQEAQLQGILDSAVYATVKIPATIQSLDTQPSPTQQAPSTYTDKKGGIRFTVPEGWSEKPLTEEREFVDVKFVNSDGNLILFGCTDIWIALPDDEKTGLSRADCSNDIMSDSDVMDMYQVDGMTVSSVHRETIQNIEYFLVRSKKNMELGPADINIDMATHLLIYNGWMYTFSFSGKADSAAYKDYKTLLSSVQYDALPVYSPTKNNTAAALGLPAETSAAMLLLNILVSLVITVTLYTVPIVIYRYAIRKGPVPPSKAKIVAIIYGIVVFIGTLTLNYLLSGKASSGGVLLWSFVNYYILKSGKARYSEKVMTGDHDISEQSVAPTADPRFCMQCGRELPPDSSYCPACGAKVH